jgi:CheY-like chemotaxis protein/KaiC/GvpD/RAD55 family RecA-like ATPase
MSRPARAERRGAVRPTGVAVVDHVLGGYPPGLPLVVAGPSGSGRTVLGLQLAQAALERGEAVEFVSSEPAASLLHQAGALGFPFEAAVASGRLALLELDAAAPSLVRAQGMAPLADALRAEAPDAALVIVDPFTAITAEVVDEPKLRELGRAFVRAIPAEHLVLTVETERLANQRGLERVLSELCGAYLRLEREPGGRRWLVVEKSRSGLAGAERVELAIGAGGIHAVGLVEPRLVVRAEVSALRRARATRKSEVAAPAPATLRASAPAISAETPPPPARSGGEAAAEAPRAAARPVVLVVDDSRVQRELASEWLGSRYEVLTAPDGFEAMQMLFTHQPDLVVLDLLMPRVTGYELLAALRRAKLDVPVLVTSSRLQRSGDRLGPLALGATDFLAKPLARLELEHKVETLLRLGRTSDRRFDPAEAEGLFARVAATRVLEAEEFGERLSRACRFGERYDLPSSLVRLSAEARTLERWIEVANEELRFEDAILRLDKRRALLLLVATASSDAPKVVERVSARADDGAGGRAALTVEVLPAAPDLGALELLDEATEEAP